MDIITTIYWVLWCIAFNLAIHSIVKQYKDKSWILDVALLISLTWALAITLYEKMHGL